MPSFALSANREIEKERGERGERDRAKHFNGVRTYGVVVPATMQYEILKAAHASAFAGHKGVRITLQRLKERFFWPGMGTDVEALVAACKVCKESKDPLGMSANREPLRPLAAPSEPNERVLAYLFLPGAVSAAKLKYVLVITDAFSKLAELVRIKDKEAGTSGERSSICGSGDI